MADRADSKRKFEVSNAPSNKRSSIICFWYGNPMQPGKIKDYYHSCFQKL